MHLKTIPSNISLNHQSCSEDEYYDHHIPKERQSIAIPYHSKHTRSIQSLLPIKVRMLKQTNAKKVNMQFSRMEQQRMKESIYYRNEIERMNESIKYANRTHSKCIHESIEQSTDKKIQIQLMSKIIDLLQKPTINQTYTPINSTMKEHPIVINNILRDTPIERIERSLVEKQLKIKLLESQRKKSKDYYQQKYCRYNMPYYKDTSSKKNVGSEDDANSIGRYERYSQQVEKLINNHQNLKQKSSPAKTFAFQNQSLKKKQKNEFSSECKDNTIESNNNHYVSEHLPLISHHEETIKLSKHKNSVVSDTQLLLQPNQQIPKQIIKQQQSASIKLDEQILTRRPILIEIPINDNQVHNISLAEAFQKRLGGLSSQKIKAEKSNKRQEQKLTNEFKINESVNSSYPNITMSLQNNIRQPRIKNKNKEKEAKISSQKISQSTTQQNSLMRQPSQQLMDRLINGSKAKISKKQMHALTRKNYQKLPQVKKKKQEEKKRLEQIQRLNKIKEYQKQLRSASNSVTTL